MAITASYCKRNAAVALTLNAATASQTVDYSDKPGENIILIVDNQNTIAGQTASVTIEKGDYLASAIGDLEVDVGQGNQVVIGPLESVRFKNSAGEVTVNVTVTNSGTVSNVKIGVVKLP